MGEYFRTMRSKQAGPDREGMRYLAVLLTVGLGWADVQFEVKESVSGHPLLVKKAGFRQRIVYFSGSKTATAENGFLMIADREQDEMILIDQQTRRFARGRLKGSRDEERKTFLDALPVGLRLVVVESGVADTWKGVPVERTLRALSIPANLSGLPADAEVRITEFSTSELPGWADVVAKSEGDDQRWSQELSAMVATMAVKDVEYHKDVLKVRSSMKTLSLPVRTISDFRLKPGAGQESAEATALGGQSLMRIEREVSGLTADPIDSAIFRVPPEFQLIEMAEMLDVKAKRGGY